MVFGLKDIDYSKLFYRLDTLIFKIFKKFKQKISAVSYKMFLIPYFKNIEYNSNITV